MEVLKKLNLDIVLAYEDENVDEAGFYGFINCGADKAFATYDQAVEDVLSRVKKLLFTARREP